MSKSPLKRYLSSTPGICMMFVGYLALLHYGWQQLQYSPVVSGNEAPATISLAKFKRIFFEGKKSDDDK